MIDTTHLRVLRTDRGYSQRNLAKAAGVDPATIRRVEDGADPGDLPLRVLDRIATALGVPPATLLRPPDQTGPDDHPVPGTGRPTDTSAERSRRLRQRIGSTLATTGTTLSALAATLDTPIETVEAELEALTDHLHALGISLARHGETLRLNPLNVHPPATATPAASAHPTGPMNVNQARLLRRIQRGEDVRRSLSKTDREITLPNLARTGLVDTSQTIPATPDTLCDYPGG
ncbi:helix-turn-helix domain-containing protein [Nocardioides sambongensis]|uniref:helix-turn-helix domain-containing protein n=1 Tax=Nocardioides sambongensis TaxID=2589074 RepID=UPI00112EF45A|nr:helix-turn-helix transcriptional regulator [Nocardioides sambongensis]